MKELEEKMEANEEANKKAQARMDSLNALRKGHVATTFPMEGIDKSSKYYRHNLTNMPLEGYYVTLDGTIVSAVIAYQKPEFLIGDFAAGASLFICKEANGKVVDLWNPDTEPNFKEHVKKDHIQAFYVGDQLYANIKNVGWRLVTSEGAIHTFVNMVKVESGGKISYQTYEQTQKMDGTAFGSIIGGPSTNVFIDMMEDCPELAQELKDGVTPRIEVIIRYNRWYDLAFPEKVKYIPGPQG